MKTKIRITITQRTVWTREGTLRAEGPVVDITPQRPESEPAVKPPGLWTRLARILTPALMFSLMASAQAPAPLQAVLERYDVISSSFCGSQNRQDTPRAPQPTGVVTHQRTCPGASTTATLTVTAPAVIGGGRIEGGGYRFEDPIQVNATVVAQISYPKARGTYVNVAVPRTDSVDYALSPKGTCTENVVTNTAFEGSATVSASNNCARNAFQSTRATTEGSVIRLQIPTYANASVLPVSGETASPPLISLEVIAIYRVEATTTGDDRKPVPTVSFPPPEPSDTSFLGKVIGGGSCFFRDEGPFTFDIPINRWIGDLPAELNPDGTLKNPPKLIANGVVSKTAKLRIAAWDVDSATRTGPVLEERDIIQLNGFDIGDLRAPSQPPGMGKQALLKGFDKQWSISEFEIPIEILRFAVRGKGFERPTPGLNEVRINIDTLSTDKPIWCTTVAWAMITIDAMAPWMLVHGTNAQHGSWEEPIQGVSFVDRLRELGIPFEHLIDLDPNGDSGPNAKQLSDKLIEITRAMGVESVHLIGHSKGGTDSRAYLSSPLYQPNPTVGNLAAKSLFVLGTPSKGTILSDLTIAANQVSIMKDATFSGPLGIPLPIPYVKAPDMSAIVAPGGPQLLAEGLLSVYSVDIANRSLFGRYVGDYLAEPPDAVKGLAPAGSALRQQTLFGMHVFNSFVKKAPGVCYYSIAGDADVDGDGEVSAAEAEGMLPADKEWNDYLKGEVVTRTMYQILGRIQRVEVVENRNPNGRKNFVVGKIRPLTELFPHGKDQKLTQYAPNDLVGPVSSVHCESCGFIPLATTENNHSSLKRKETVDFIRDKINSNFPLGKPALPCSK